MYLSPWACSECDKPKPKRQAKSCLRNYGGEEKGRKERSKQDAAFQDIRWEVLVTASGMHIFHLTRGTVCVKALALLSKAFWYSVLSQGAVKDCEMRLWMVGHVMSDGKVNLPLCHWTMMNNLSEVLQSLEISSTTPLWKQYSIHFHPLKELRSHNFFCKQCCQKLGNWWGF